MQASANVANKNGSRTSFTNQAPRCSFNRDCGNLRIVALVQAMALSLIVVKFSPHSSGYQPQPILPLCQVCGQVGLLLYISISGLTMYYNMRPIILVHSMPLHPLLKTCGILTQVSLITLHMISRSFISRMTTMGVTLFT